MRLNALALNSCAISTLISHTTRAKKGVILRVKSNTDFVFLDKIAMLLNPLICENATGGKEFIAHKVADHCSFEQTKYHVSIVIQILFFRLQ